MKVCEDCKHEVQWRYKESWGIMACPGWFAGTCEGPPQGVIFPSVGTIRPRSGDEDATTYAIWLNTRLRKLWPLDSLE